MFLHLRNSTFNQRFIQLLKLRSHKLIRLWKENYLPFILIDIYQMKVECFTTHQFNQSFIKLFKLWSHAPIQLCQQSSRLWIQVTNSKKDTDISFFPKNNKQIRKMVHKRYKNSLFNVSFVCHKIHFGEDINMRHFKLDHCRKWSHATTYKFGDIGHELVYQNKLGLHLG